MEFQFNVNEYFKSPIVEIGNTLLPPDFSGDRRALWNTVNKVAEIVNELGEASAHAQGLTKPITTADRLRQSDQNLYLLVDPDANNGKGAVTGMLKVGRKGLYVFDREGQHYQVTPPCVLDFYVHEKKQRNGYGKKLFEYMLEKENVKPHNLAIDRPSEKFLNFLNKHYCLQSPIKQMNNYVVFDGFFPENLKKETTECSPISRTNGLQSTQSSNTQPLYGRYGAPRPPCSMGQIIHNTAAQKNSEPTSPNNYVSPQEFPQNPDPREQGIELQYRIPSSGLNSEQLQNRNQNGYMYNMPPTNQQSNLKEYHRTGNNYSDYNGFQHRFGEFHNQNNCQQTAQLFSQQQNSIFPGKNETTEWKYSQPVYANSSFIPNQSFDQPCGKHQTLPLSPDYEQKGIDSNQIPQDYSAQGHCNVNYTYPMQTNTHLPTANNITKPFGPHMGQYFPQQHMSQQRRQSIVGPEISYTPQQNVPYYNHSDREVLELPQQTAKYESQIRSPQQRPVIPSYPQYFQESPQNQSHADTAPQNLLKHSVPPPKVESSAAFNIPTIPQQYPHSDHNQQTEKEIRTNISTSKQNLSASPLFPSQRIPHQPEYIRNEKQEYQHSAPIPQALQAKPAHVSCNHESNDKKIFEPETVHSLLQVDPKYFKPDPIQLKQSSHIMQQSPSQSRFRQEETVASLMKAEQEFFENGLLRDEYRGNSAPAYLDSHDREDNPKQTQITHSNNRVYSPQLQALPQANPESSNINHSSHITENLNKESNEIEQHGNQQGERKQQNNHENMHTYSNSKNQNEQRMKSESHSAIQPVQQSLNPLGPQQVCYSNHGIRQEQMAPSNQYDMKPQAISGYQQPFGQRFVPPEFHAPNGGRPVCENRNFEMKGGIEQNCQYLSIQQNNNNMTAGRHVEIAEEPRINAVNKSEDICQNGINTQDSPETIRQSSYIANNFNTHPEGLNERIKSSDEKRIHQKKKDINRQYGLNDLELKKRYQSAFTRRTSDIQEVDNLEYGYPPQISKKRPVPRNILTMRGR